MTTLFKTAREKPTTGALYYFEIMNFAGKWRPQTSPRKPEIETKGGCTRVRMIGAQGPRIRAVKPVDKGHLNLSLAQLFELYSPDGSFRYV